MNHNDSQMVSWQTNNTKHALFLQSPSEGRLVSSCIRAPGITAMRLLDHTEGQARLFWQNGRDQTAFAGFGIAVEIMAWGDKRFVEINSKAAALFSTADVHGIQDSRALPRLFGGFSFRDDFTPDNTWAVFYPAHFILPHFQLTQDGSDSWLTINAILPADEDLSSARRQLKEALLARYEALLLVSEQPQSTSKSSGIVAIRYPMSIDIWTEKIEAAISKMRASEMDKVVLARVCELRARRRIDVRKAIDYLDHNYHECIRFLFEARPNHAFYGATPELLVQANDRQMSTMALAGSVRRGANNIEDLRLSTQLMESDKERYEHALVVDSIRRRLEPVTSTINVAKRPEIYSLSYIHHLLTPITAELKQPLGVLPLVEILHPTPALGGSPRQVALDFIEYAEPVPRGWYAGPIGWIDNNLNGEFGVAIRSAVAQERRVWLYAGAGIVADSEAAKEWAETSLKFQPMFAALGMNATTIETAQRGSS